MNSTEVDVENTNHVPKRHQGAVSTVAIGADGHIAVSGGQDGSVLVWEDGLPRRMLRGHKDNIFAVTLSPDTGRVYSAGCEEIRMWDAKTGECLHVMNDRQTIFYALKIHTDGCTLVTGSMDQKIQFWNAQTLDCVREISTNQSVLTLDFSPDGSIVYTGGCRGIQMWNVATGQCMNKYIGAPGKVNALCVSPDGQTIYCGYEDGILLAVNTHNGKVIRNFKGHRGEVLSICLKGDTLYSGSSDSTLRIWNVQTEQCNSVLDFESIRFCPKTLSDTFVPCSVSAVASSPDNMMICIGLASGNVYFENL